MGANFAPELIRLLIGNGCQFVRHGKGDHDIWFSPHTGIRFPVDQRIKSRHTANAVLRSREIISWTNMGALAGCDARRRTRRMAIPCKRPATPQRACQGGQIVQVIVSRLLKQAGLPKHF